MTTRTDQTVAPRRYELHCVDCSFDSTVEGDVFAVLDVIDAHQEEYAVDALDHFVEFESVQAV